MPKIILDFDYTLFDVDKFKDAMYRAVRPYLIKKTRKFWDDEKHAIQDKLAFYDHKAHIKNIVEPQDVKKAEAEVNKVIKNSKKYLYKDTLDFIKKYKKHKIYIVSFGVDGFQKEKIKATGIDKKAKVIITRGKKYPYFKKIVKKNEVGIFIEDKGSEIDMVKKNYPEIVCYWMRRKNGRFRNDPCKNCDYKINNLKIKI